MQTQEHPRFSRGARMLQVRSRVSLPGASVPGTNLKGTSFKGEGRVLASCTFFTLRSRRQQADVPTAGVSPGALSPVSLLEPGRPHNLW